MFTCIQCIYLMHNSQCTSTTLENLTDSWSCCAAWFGNDEHRCLSLILTWVHICTVSLKCITCNHNTIVIHTLMYYTTAIFYAEYILNSFRDGAHRSASYLNFVKGCLYTNKAITIIYSNRTVSKIFKPWVNVSTVNTNLSRQNMCTHCTLLPQ